MGFFSGISTPRRLAGQVVDCSQLGVSFLRRVFSRYNRPAMRHPWTSLARASTPDGPLELRRRGEREFHLTLQGRIVMTSAAHGSEEALAKRACGVVKDSPVPRVLVAGLGMGFTLRACLDSLPPTAQVRVCELNPVVVEWCREFMGVLTDSALEDPRVSVETGNVAMPIARGAASPLERFDAVILDLYEGPKVPLGGGVDPVFGTEALGVARRSLRKGGVLAVWSEQEDPPFEKRMARAGYRLEKHRAGRGGRIHFVYLGFPLAGNLPS